MTPSSPDPRLGRWLRHTDGTEQIVTSVGHDGVVRLESFTASIPWAAGQPLPAGFAYLNGPTTPKRPLTSCERIVGALDALALAALHLRDNDRHDDARKVEAVHTDAALRLQSLAGGVLHGLIQRVDG